VALGRLLDALDVVQKGTPVVFPVHPRTQKNVNGSGFGKRLKGMPGLRLVDPLGYLDFLKLMSSARAVLTDSGGIQEEATVLQVPCITLRANTERPVTCQIGSSRIVGNDTGKIISA